jgi:predicted acetyltransferase
VAFVDAETARRAWPEAMARAMAGRAGFFPRTKSQWETFHEDDPEQRDGGSAYFHVVYRADGRIDGTATYRVHRHWPERIFANEVRVRELMAVTDEAHRALWHFILGIDLVGEIVADLRPPDDALPAMLADTRRLRRLVQDGMWLRLVDVRAALERRTYATSDSFVLEVRDAFCPWNAGRVRLTVSPEGATCAPTSEDPELVVEASVLASAYLGGARLHALARARGVEERTPGALSRASAAFATPDAPWSPVFF